MTSIEAIVRETPRQRWIRRLKRALLNVAFGLLAYGLLVLGVRLLHRRVVYQPPADEADKAVPEGATLLTARAADGVTVHALAFDAPRSSRTIVHFHGNAETVDASAFVAREMRKRGFSTVLVEYRGYGRSRGTAPTEAGLYLDAAAVLDALAARGVTSDRVVLWGQSLGTGVAAEMASRGRGGRMVLVAPFTSMLDMARRVAPFVPASAVMVDRFDSLSKAPDITVPTLVVHGDLDDVIPVTQGERLSKALPRGTLLRVPEGRHDNLYKFATVLPAIAEHVGAGR